MSLPLSHLEWWQTGTAQPSIPVNNNALRTMISMKSAVSDSVTAQPSLSAPDDDGLWYVIPAGATGSEWATFAENSCAIFYGGAWYEFVPEDGDIVAIQGVLYEFSPSNGWGSIGGGGGGGDVNGPASSVDDRIAIFSGTTGKIIEDGGATIAEVRAIPQNSQSSAYTLVLSDAGKHVYHPSADTTARIWTIPANGSVAFPIGTAVTFVNDTSAGVITIAITTDTLVLMGSGSTGSRTLAANGIATAIKVTSTRWVISGTGLS